MRVLFLVFGLLIGAGAPVVAQEMPAWAAPQESFEAREPAPAPEVSTPNSGAIPCPGANPNDCIDVTPAPVDGGLALLALLGTGYAVRRLRHEADEG